MSVSHIDPVSGEPYESQKASTAEPQRDAQPAPQLGEPMDAATAAAVMRRLKIVLSAMALVLGIATIIVTIAAGGGATARGILLGGVLALMGGARLYLTLRHEV